MKKISLTLTLIIFAIVFTIGAFALNVEEAFSFEEFSLDGAVIPYRLYVPEDYNEGNEYPLVVFLHGAGERGKDNDLQLKNAVQTLFDREDGLMAQSIVIAPQCPEGEQWVDTPWAEGNYSTDLIPESDELMTVMALISSLKEEYSIDPARIYAMGVSMGGFGTWDLIIRHNDVFAAAAPMCGGGDPEKAASLVETPIYTFHGTADASVPFEGTEEMVAAIEDEAGRLINFVVYEGEGHGIWEKAAAEDGWVEWLFSQKLTDRYPALETEPEETTADTEALPETKADETTPAETDEKENETNTVEPVEDKGGSFPIWIIPVVAVVIIAIIIAVAFVKKKN